MFLLFFNLLLSFFNDDTPSAAVTAGSELSFDYQWPVSSRPPTKCYCLTPTCRGYLEVGLDANSSKKKKDKDKDKDKEMNKNRYEGDDITFNSSGYGKTLAVERYNDEYRYGRRRGVWKARTEIPYVHIHIENTDIRSTGTVIKNENENIIHKKEENIDNIKTIENMKVKTETLLENEMKIEKEVEKEFDYTTTLSYRQFLSRWLVGKYVRVWWLENMRFFEAEVGDYNTKKGQFS